MSFPIQHHRMSKPSARIAAQVDAQSVAAWNQAIAAKMSEGLSRAAATTAVVRRDPDLHRRFLIAANRHKPAIVEQLQDIA